MQLYLQAAVTKVDKIAGFLKLEKMLEPAYKEEKRRLEARWSAYQNGFDRCKAMLLEFLRSRGEKRIKGQTNTIASPTAKPRSSSRTRLWFPRPTSGCS